MMLTIGIILGACIAIGLVGLALLITAEERDARIEDESWNSRER